MHDTHRIAGLLLALAAPALAQFSNPVYEEQAARAKAAGPANRARVLAEMRAAGMPAAPVAWFTVPAMSDRMRLTDTYPVDGHLAGELRAVAAQNEFEPASFQLFAFEKLDTVEVRPGALAGPGGSVLPGSALDMRVVKLWFQNGNGWVSYFSDVGLKLVPELLLHDENMVKVDLANAANYARLKDDRGERFVWISAPRKLEPAAFNPLTEPFADAATMQPVALEKDSFKQFVLTVHPAKDQKPGVYRGKVAVSARGKLLAEIPVAVRVLPFELPAPRPYDDLDGDFVASFMGGTSLGSLESTFCDKARARGMYRDYLVNLRDHGFLNVPVFDEETVALLKEVGLPTRPVIGALFLPWYGLNFGGRLSFDNVMAAKDSARRCREFYMRILGHSEILAGYGDEQGSAFVAAHREAFKPFLEYPGIRIGCAGHDSLLNRGGYIYDFYPMGGAPDSGERIRKWKEIGDKQIGFYAVQHNGSENPQFVRYQHGLLGYFSGLNMTYNYEFALGPWNDLSYDLYKPMVVTYMNAGGLVETFAWSGFREGIDDIRYATCLKQLVRESRGAADVDTRLEGRKALQYLALLERRSMDLDAVRAEMVEKILKLRKMLGK